ncbi:MAG: response regulator [Myxococcales bacterium]|nr:response regulator [Myxococcales bacterium]MCB9691538.1 response regulator [Alphaproteobacteria bacterium]
MGHLGTVLVVEDDRELAGLVASFLEKNGFTVGVEHDGARAIERIPEESPDVVVLDIMLPGADGLQVCRSVRAAYTGAILMLTARDDDLDEVIGLEVGADDYMAKPVRPRVLLARLTALLRRLGPRSTEITGSGQRIVVGPMVLNTGTREVTVHDEAIVLTTAEFELLHFLAERAGTVVDRDTLYRELRGIEWDGVDRSIDLRVSRVRRRMGDAGNLIKSVRGMGYQLAVP